MGKKDKDSKKNKDARKNEAPEFNAHELAQSITQTARSMRTVLSRSLTDSGLYAGQDGVILLLSREDGLAPGQIAQRLGVKAPTMTRTIGRMEAQGFVTRGTDDSDGRLTKVHLTELGLKSVALIDQSVDACGRQATRDMSAKEIKSLMKLLKVVDRNLHGEGPEVSHDEE